MNEKLQNGEKMKRKILICGATGFIGRNMAEYFAKDEEFRVYGTYLRSKPLNNRKIRMIKTELTDRKNVNKAIKGKDIIIQAAAATSGAKDTVKRPHYHVTDNAVMNALIFRAAFDYKVSRLVFLSCTTMYQSSETPIRETDFDANRQMHPGYFGGAWTKVYNEKMCEFYSRIGVTKYTVIRHSNIYGPYDKFDLEKSHVFGATITKVMAAKDGGEIVVWGQGQEERDLLHVFDLVDFVRMAIDKQNSKFELFNLGSGSSISVKELVRKIIAHSGKDISIKYDIRKPSIKTKICLDSTKAKDAFAWSSRISLDEGIKKTIEWHRNNINVP